MTHKPHKIDFLNTVPIRKDRVMLLVDNIESALEHTSTHGPFTSAELAHAFYMIMFEYGNGAGQEPKQ